MPTFDKRTPDVYVEEVSLFPPSVAQVETAIPAFIGYTEMARFRGKHLASVPTKIDSMVEFEERFGGAPPVNVSRIDLGADNAVLNADIQATYYLYDSMRLFFRNGGGKCYIVSVGSYSDPIGKSALEAGINALEKWDEPTMIVFPDAVLLKNDTIYELQKTALAQANKLQDRFVIMDLLEATDDPSFDWKKGYEEFRDRIGINNLKYGAAYTPHLLTNLPNEIRFRDIQEKLTKLGAPVDLKSIAEDATIEASIQTLVDVASDANTVQSAVTAADLVGNYNTLLQAFRMSVNTPTPTADEVRPSFVALFAFIYHQADALLDTWAVTGGLVDTDNTNHVRQLITNSLRAQMLKLNSYNEFMSDVIGGDTDVVDTRHAGLTFSATEWTDAFTAVTADNGIYVGDDTDPDTRFKKRMKAGEPHVTAIFEILRSAVDGINTAFQQRERDLDGALAETFPVYRNIVSEVAGALTVLPPSGAIAGVYATVDRERGVWKAPANVSLNSVSELTYLIDNTDQDDLNVDVVAGKSINAIRPFTGRGILVWGARTLAGNDKEWRYVNVRRFFNMVEESSKKSTNWAVFEPNDANLWIKVKAMLENFLTNQWRDGALQGAAPQDAFFVNVGLGTTMTPQDILDGYLIVDIGMAVVRPAEFIVLRFSHKLAES